VNLATLLEEADDRSALELYHFQTQVSVGPMDLLTPFCFTAKILLQGRGRSEATDRPLVGGSKLAPFRAIRLNKAQRDGKRI